MKLNRVAIDRQHSLFQASAFARAGQARRGAVRIALSALCLTPWVNAHAQDAALVQPTSYKVVMDNEKMRVLEYNSRPGMGVCGSGIHSHPAHLTLSVTATKAKAKLPDGKTLIAENQPGDVFWSEAETHEVENIGGKNAKVLLIELKSGATKP